nr:immunoglobulin heavy chain junction region [Macaca mulatta]MOW23197.1 immunoglobulin heavy chain junction region [Macaca mulatta]MOW23278.1 immunoglobulin heavy chain junction region [Macaca mulatta]MOW23308.1 immunoglobulin heavy chain junction region [Macaca mulatta]MOW23426.1 immunoglobulin heavy chain junction region [Macaca mulatta]
CARDRKRGDFFDPYNRFDVW